MRTSSVALCPWVTTTNAAHNDLTKNKKKSTPNDKTTHIDVRALHLRFVAETNTTELKGRTRLEYLTTYFLGHHITACGKRSMALRKETSEEKDD